MTRRFLTQPGSGVSDDAQPTDIIGAVLGGVRKYGSVKVPVLAIYAYPTKIPPKAAAAAREEIQAHDTINKRMVDLFAKGNPKAKVVYIANSEHDVFNSNSSEVEQEMKAFIGPLPR